MLNKQPLLILIKSSNQDYNNHKTVRKLEDICKMEASRVSPVPLHNTPALNHSGSNSSLYLVFCSADCHLLKSLQLPWAQCVPLPTEPDAASQPCVLPAGQARSCGLRAGAGWVQAFPPEPLLPIHDGMTRITTTWKLEARGRLVTGPTATDLEKNRTRYGALIRHRHHPNPLATFIP